MNSKERVLTTFEYREPDRVPVWLGASPEFINKAIEEFDLNSEEELLQLFGDDFRRVIAPYRYDDPEYENNTPFGIPREGFGYGMAMSHPLSDASIDDVRVYSWPDPNNVDISNYRCEAKKHYDSFAILGGDWSPFWHDLTDLLGMENMFIRMCMEPEMVQYTIERIVDYYIEVNTRIFEEAADLIDIFFLGNDFGSNTGPLLDVGLFDQFIVPQLKRLIGLGHRYGLKVMMHCCGGFRELIPSMIESGLDCLHAIQPSCRGMDIEELKTEFGDHIVFNGCIDSNLVLIQGTSDQVQLETRRTLDIMKPGGGFIAGASHDYLLEETPVENVLTMFETIRTYGKY
ncbi:MAG: uroporphyrinogen decarboxylase family protein [Bacteroidota bacterium]